MCMISAYVLSAYEHFEAKVFITVITGHGLNTRIVLQYYLDDMPMGSYDTSRDHMTRFRSIYYDANKTTFDEINSKRIETLLEQMHGDVRAILSYGDKDIPGILVIYIAHSECVYISSQICFFLGTLQIQYVCVFDEDKDSYISLSVSQNDSELFPTKILCKSRVTLTDDVYTRVFLEHFRYGICPENIRGINDIHRRQFGETL